LQVFVRDNNVDQALRALKKKMQREGIFREMKRRKAYEKPSERKTREKAEAIRRARKAARKQAQREGLIPPPQTPGGRAPSVRTAEVVLSFLRSTAGARSADPKVTVLWSRFCAGRKAGYGSNGLSAQASSNNLTEAESGSRIR